MSSESNTPSEVRRVFERMLARIDAHASDLGEYAVTLELLRILIADALEELERT